MDATLIIQGIIIRSYSRTLGFAQSSPYTSLDQFLPGIIFKGFGKFRAVCCKESRDKCGTFEKLIIPTALLGLLQFFTLFSEFPSKLLLKVGHLNPFTFRHIRPCSLLRFRFFFNPQYVSNLLEHEHSSFLNGLPENVQILGDIWTVQEHHCGAD